MQRFFLACLFTMLLSACASSGVDRSEVNQSVEIIYGEVLETEAVALDSKADEAFLSGAVAGAAEGAIFGEDSDDILVDSMVGAVAAALVVLIEEGSRDATLVSLKTRDSETQAVITDQENIQVGQCLRMVKGFEVFLSEVDAKFCRPNTEEARVAEE